MRIDGDAAALIQRHARGIEPQAGHIGAAANGQQHHIGAQRLLRPAGSRLQGEGDAGIVSNGRDHLGLELELEALLGEDALEALAHLGVHRRDQPVEEFDHRHLGAETRPDRAHLQANIAAADHHEMAGHGIEFQPTGGGDDALLINGDAGQRNALGARGDDDVLGGIFGAIHGHGAGFYDPALALQPSDLVLLEEELDAFDIGANHLGLAGLHALEVQRHLADIDAMLGQLVDRLLIMLGALQQRLGGDAANIEAGAAQRRAFFDAGHLHPQLRGANGANITARTGADDNDVETLRHG